MGHDHVDPGLPEGITWSDVPKVLGIAFSCFVLIVAQSAATSRSFALKHGQRVDVNRDILGLSGANLAAGLGGTFVVNRSPTKTEILDEQKGRTQVANLTMSAVVLIVVLFATGLLTNMPKAVLAGIVFLIGLGLVDVAGLRRIYQRRFSEFVVACLTGFIVFAVGVGQGIILAIVLSILEIIRRAYGPADFVVGEGGEGGEGGERTYQAAKPGVQSAPASLSSATTRSSSKRTTAFSPPFGPTASSIRSDRYMCSPPWMRRSRPTATPSRRRHDGRPTRNGNGGVECRLSRPGSVRRAGRVGFSGELHGHGGWR